MRELAETRTNSCLLKTTVTQTNNTLMYYQKYNKIFLTVFIDFEIEIKTLMRINT